MKSRFAPLILVLLSIFAIGIFYVTRSNQPLVDLNLPKQERHSSSIKEESIVQDDRKVSEPHQNIDDNVSSDKPMEQDTEHAIHNTKIEITAKNETTQPIADERSQRIEVLKPKIYAFNDWVKTSDVLNKKQLSDTELSQGVELATSRRTALKELIQLDPKLAIESKVLIKVRNGLPSAINNLLEERVSGKGDYGVLISRPTEETNQSTIRHVITIGKKSYDGFVYGRRSMQKTKININMNGIAVDNVMAVDENPVRKVEPEEITEEDLLAAEESSCAISGKNSKSNDDLSVAEVGGKKFFLCSGGHIYDLNEELIEEEDGQGSGDNIATNEIASSPWTTGNKTVLYIIVKFSDQSGEPQSVSNAVSMMNSVDAFIQSNSYGLTSMTTTVAPVVYTLPGDTAFYVTNGDFKLQADARAIAAANGYNYLDYNLDAVRWNGGPGSYGGQAYVGWRGCWLKSSSVGVAAHEFGHNYGLWHANFYSTSDGTAIGSGNNNEYGDSFDTMGSAAAGANHFNAYQRKILDWIPAVNTPLITTSGNYQLYSFDTASVIEAGKNYGLQIKKETTGYNRTYWLDYRQAHTANSWLMNGIDLHWGAWGVVDSNTSSSVHSNRGSQLLDTTPLSPGGKTDSAIVIGRTFSDVIAGVHITPTGKGGTVPESLHVTVNLGSFTGNAKPTNITTASVTSAAINEVINFTCSANDPDGDELAYYWDFGNYSNSINNSNVQSKSYSVAGVYSVTCTASDKKGGVNSQTVVVTVGSPTTFTISGKVRDSSLVPIQGVIVKWGTAISITDDNGDYLISNIGVGSNSLVAYKHLHTITPNGFSNPIIVGPSASNINFTAQGPYTITSSSGPNGSISPLGNVSVKPGTAQTFTITPNSGYSVDTVLVNGASVGSVTTYTFSNVNANHTISVTFKPRHIITASVSGGGGGQGGGGAGGYITPSGSVYVDSGASQTFTIVPNSGKSVGLVTVDGFVVGSGTTYTFTKVTANHTINATFVNTISTYTITASSGANGTMNPIGAVVVNSGNSQTFNMMPNTGYEVDTVTVNGASVGSVNSYTFSNVSANHTIAVTYKLIAPDTIAPSVPSGLAASAISSTGFTLTWAPSTDNIAVTGYEIFRNGVSIGTSTTTSRVVTGLSPSTSYNMTVRARDAVPNWSAQSSALSVTTLVAPDSIAPSVPAGLNATSINLTSFTLNWTASTDNVAVTGYEVFRGGVSIGTTTATSFVVLGLSTNTSYNMTVRARDAIPNWSAQSSVLSVSTLADIDPPSVPTGLAASSKTLTSFTLSWSASTDNIAVVEYEIFIDGSSYSTSTTTSKSITGLTESTTYSMTVRARDAAFNWSNVSSSFNVTTLSPPDTTAPSIPDGLNASSVSTTSFTLNWSASTDNVAVTGYEVFRNGVSVGTSTTTSRTITGLTAGTTYSMTVRARDAVPNWSAQSSALSVTTLAAPDTVAPSVPAGLASSAITSTGFTLSWTASTDNVAVTGYEIFRGGVSIGTSATTSFAVTGLSASTTYSMTVRARDAVPNWSAQSSALSVTTSAVPDTVAPSVPAGLAASAITSTGFTLSWTASTDNVAVTGYEIFRGGVSIGTSATTSFAVTGLSASTTYSMTVRARDAVPNWSAQSSALSVTTSAAPDTVAPSVPAGLASSAITSTGFTLSWTASTDNVAVTGYEIFRGGVSIGTSATTSFAVTGLSASTTYSMTVRARDAVPNWSAQSSALSVTTSAAPDTVAPSVPAGLASSAITSTGFTLSWTASTDNVAVTGYEVFRGGVSIGTSATTSFTVTGLSASTTYSMTVRARDAVPNWSAQSSALSVTTSAAPDTVAPSVPAGLAASAITSTGFTLSWTASTDNVAVTGYEVFRGGVSIGTSATTSFTVTGLSASTTYSMTVRARDAVPNWSAQSSALSVTTSAAPDTVAPSVPAGLAASAITSTGFTLSWTASTDNVAVTGYEIFRGGVSIGTSATTSFAVTGLSASTTYSMTVRARDAVPNWSAQSSALSVTTSAAPDTVAPSVPAGLASSAITSTGFTLSWTASTDNVAVTGYEIFRGGVSIGTSATTSFAVTGLSASTTYSMTVRARDAVPNWSAQSSALSVTTSAAPDTIAPSVPAGLVASAITSTGFTLSWTASTDNVAVTGYEIFRGGVSIGTSATTSFAVTGLSASTTYSMTVRARDAVPNWSAQSSALSVTTSAVYLITASAGANGSISPSGSVSVDSGNNQTFAMIPSTGYHVSDVLVNGVSIGAVNSYTFSNVTTSHTISVSFAINTYNIVASAGANGSISPSGTITKIYNSSQTFNIAPNGGFVISDVLVNGVSQGVISTYTFNNIASSHTIVASFAPAPVIYTIIATSGINGSISPAGSVSVTAGLSQSFVFIPSSGYEVNDVLVNGVSVGVVSSYVFSGVSSNHTIDVSFKASPIVYTINASASANGSISPSGNVSVTAGNSQSFSIAASSGFEILDVVVNGSSVGAVSSYTFSSVFSNHTISASFKASPKIFTITSSAGANGTISPLGPQSVSENGSLGFTITPQSGFEIDTLVVDGSSVPATNSYIFSNVLSNHTISVTFKLIPVFKNIVASTTIGGSISPDGIVVVPVGANQTFAIKAQPGFFIKDVLVDSVSQGKISSYTFINVVSDRKIEAIFEASKVTHEIVSSVFGNGTISPLGTTNVTAGSSQTYIITPASGSEIDTVVVDGFSIGAVKEYTFTNVLAPHTIESRFKVAIKNYTISSSKSANGTIDPLGNTLVKEGGNLTILIKPVVGFQVGVVLVDGVAIAPNPKLTQYEFLNVQRNHAIDVSFDPIVLDNTKVITSFKFAHLNPQVYGIIRGNKISVTVGKDVNRSSLIPSFTFIGKKVTVNGVSQVSGVTKQDFTKVVEYVVEAEDGSAFTYFVDVKNSARIKPGLIQLQVERVGVSAEIDKITIMVSRSGGSEGDVTAYYESEGLDVISSKRLKELTGSVFWADGDSKDKAIEALVSANSSSSADSFKIFLTEVDGAFVGEIQSSDIVVNSSENGGNISSGSGVNDSSNGSSQSSGGGGGCNYAKQMPLNEQAGNIIFVFGMLAVLYLRNRIKKEKEV